MDIIDLLILNGADVNRLSDRVLVIAAKLLDAGADPSPKIDAEHLTSPLFSALGAAATIKGARRAELVRMLLKADADPNAALPDGTTPLHVAVMIDSSYVKLLLDADADKMARDGRGRTAYGIAWRRFKIGSVLALAFH